MAEANTVEPFVNAQTVADRFHVKRTWVYDATRRYGMPHYKLGGLKKYRLSEVEAWINAQRQGDTA